MCTACVSNVPFFVFSRWAALRGKQSYARAQAWKVAARLARERGTELETPPLVKRKADKRSEQRARAAARLKPADTAAGAAPAARRPPPPPPPPNSSSSPPPPPTPVPKVTLVPAQPTLPPWRQLPRIKVISHSQHSHAKADISFNVLFMHDLGAKKSGLCYHTGRHHAIQAGILRSHGKSFVKIVRVVEAYLGAVHTKSVSISFTCRAGRHRSVACAELMASYLTEQHGAKVVYL